MSKRILVVEDQPDNRQINIEISGSQQAPSRDVAVTVRM
jgi:hypothetical protein